MSLLISNIGSLITNGTEFADLNELSNAALVIDQGKVAWVGPSSAAPDCDERLDVAGACVIPGFVDSHSHLVFAGSREAEFAARMGSTLGQAGC